MTLSFGVAQANREDSVESLMQRLQAALAGAKNSGRNRVIVKREDELAA